MPDAGFGAWLRLTLVPGLGGQGLRKLLGDFGLPSQVLGAGRAALVRSVGDALAQRIAAEDGAAAVDAALDWAAAPGHSIVTLADAAYPKQLLEIPDPPALLYVLGNADLLAHRGLAIMGQPQRDAPLGQGQALETRSARRNWRASAGLRSASTPRRTAARSTVPARRSPSSAAGWTSRTRSGMRTCTTSWRRAARSSQSSRSARRRSRGTSPGAIA